MGIRADMILKIVYNSNQFQAGRYILAVSPHGGGSKSKNNTMENGTRFADLTTITQLPHVQFDINTESSATLVVPYTSVYSHMPVNPSSVVYTHSMGTILLAPYAPLVTTAGSSTVPFDLFVSFDNIDLAAPVYPQSRNHKDTVSKEQYAAKIGPVGAGAGKVATVANLIGDRVPLLSGIAKPVAWAADIFASVANVFGWSNPIVLSPANRITNTAFAYANNPDAGDNSVPLSLFAGNQVEVMPGYAGSDLDEMALSYLIRIPAYIDSFSWSTSTAINTVLGTYTVSPFQLKRNRFSGLTSVTTMTPVAFLSNIFKYYRGGIKYRIKLVKTGFHSGRLLICFNPSPFATPTTISSLIQSTYINRQIVDISSQTEFEYTVPYVSLSPWKPTQGNYSAIGNLVIVVANPLVAPATVSSSITVIVEACGADDMEFNVPTNHNLQPVVVYDPQSFDPRGAAGVIDSGDLGSSTLDSNQHYAARACVGEKTLSLLSYVKSADFSSTEISVVNSLTYYPFVSQYVLSSPTVASTPNMVTDNFGLIKSLYLYNRGSVRIRLVPVDNQSVDLKSSKLLNQSSSSPDYTGYTTGAISTGYDHGMIAYNTTRSGGIEVQIPQYHRFPMRIQNDDILNSAYNVNFNVPTTTSFLLEMNARETFSVNLARAAGDDFHCGFFIGVPPMTAL